MKIIAAILIVCIGCGASTPVPQFAGVSEKQYVENKPLPARPDAEKIPADQDWTRPLPAGQCTKEDGVLLSPAKAARAKLWQEDDIGIRATYELDKQIWQQHRIVYDERIAQANAEIKRRSPSWWDENKGTLGWAGGFLMGAATTIAIVYGLDHIRQ
jgi:hypothetical protein